eukprot:s178_g14.t1
MAWAKECVKKGVDVNARLDAYGGTALFLAIEQGNWDMMKWLVEEAKVDLEILDYGGYNALDYAAACHWHHPDRPPMLPGGKPAPMDIASFLKSQGRGKHSNLGCRNDLESAGQLVNASGAVLDRGLLIEQTGLQNGDSLTLHIRPLQLQASAYAFAAVLGDGSVMTWADSGYGGDSSDVQSQLKNGQQIQASRCGSAFAAILSDRSVVTWVLLPSVVTAVLCRSS